MSTMGTMGHDEWSNPHDRIILKRKEEERVRAFGNERKGLPEIKWKERGARLRQDMEVYKNWKEMRIQRERGSSNKKERRR